MDELPITVAATFCATLVDEWIRCGLTDAVVAPGSRSTPLAVALVADDRMRVHIHHDERSAAFLALGLATATGRPAPVLTTSGTAAVELHPAVVEAHHGQVPMICCTADRPPELLHVGAPQTVDQTKLFGDVVRWYADLGVPDEAARGAWRSVAARTVAESTASPAGPVQLNLAFRDPLVGAPGELPPGRVDGQQWHRFRQAAGIDQATLEEFLAAVVGRRGVVIAGGAGPGCSLDPTVVHDLARALGWPVLADPRSGCRTPEPTTISHGDVLVRQQSFVDAHRPEVIVQLGESAASKVLGQWMTSTGADLIVVDRGGRWIDPDRRALVVFGADPTTLAGAVGAEVHRRGIEAVEESWIESWASADAAASTALARTLAGHDEATEPAVARDLMAGLPDGSRLVVSSSMPVRDLEWFAGARRGVTVHSNRGANGIDGVVSTAVGIALAGDPTALLIGDVALLHDSNGLLGVTRRALHLVIVAVDNDGGGIFSFLPQASALAPERFELLFGTPHGVDLAALGAVHGIAVSMIATQAELAPAVDRAISANGGVHLIVVRTDRGANVAVHDELNAAVAAALAS